jgi:uncharacterized protein (DUF427 family)
LVVDSCDRYSSLRPGQRRADDTKRINVSVAHREALTAPLVPTGGDVRPHGIALVGAVVEPTVSAGHTINIVPSESHVEVRLGPSLLASSDRTMRLEETGLPSRYYIPRDDVRMELLRTTSFHTTCPFKGDASYFSVDLDGQTHEGIVWSYEIPKPNASKISGMLSFYPDRAEVTVDGEALDPD